MKHFIILVLAFATSCAQQHYTPTQTITVEGTQTESCDIDQYGVEQYPFYPQ